MDYKTHGVCSSMIHVELDGDKIKDVDFVGGCNGNLQWKMPSKDFPESNAVPKQLPARISLPKHSEKQSLNKLIQLL